MLKPARCSALDRTRMSACDMRLFWTPSRLSFMDLMRGGIFAVLGTCGAFGASPPGSLISVTAMSGATEGASAYRILYTSTGLSGEPTPTAPLILGTRDLYRRPQNQDESPAYDNLHGIGRLACVVRRRGLPAAGGRYHQRKCG
jgi:hypothetical protein